MVYEEDSMHRSNFTTYEIQAYLRTSTTSVRVDSLAPTNLVHLPPRDRAGLARDIRGGGDGALLRCLDCSSCAYVGTCDGGECRRMN